MTNNSSSSSEVERKPHNHHGLIDEEEHLENLTQVPDNLPKLPEPPNGGLHAWLQVLAAFLANFNSWGIVNAFGVYQEFYQNELLKSRSPFQISWIIGLSGALTLFSANFFGILIDMGLVKYMAFCGCLLQFTALMLLSWSKTYAEVILTQGLFVGMCSGLLFIISISTVAPFFSTKRPFAIGLGASGSSIGGTVYSVMARRLIGEVKFGWSTRIIAFVEVSTAAVMFFCVKRLLPPTRRKSLIAFECFTEPATMAYSLGNTFGFLSMYTFYVYNESYATSTTTHPVNAYLYLTAITNAGSLLGRVIPSYVATKVGPFNVLLVSDICTLVVLFCWLAAKNKGGVIAVTILFGFVSGPLMALPGSIVSALTKDFNRLGIRLSFCFTFMASGIVLGPAIAGIIERKYGWFWLKMYASLSWILCLVFHSIARIILSGFKLNAKV